MTKDEALKLALEALEEAHYKVEHKQDAAKREQAITAIKEALAQPVQEPVATKNNEGITLHVGWDDLPVGTKLYTTLPQRPWVDEAAIRADEREACAKVCDEVGEHPSLTPRHCAEGIRARGNT